MRSTRRGGNTYAFALSDLYPSAGNLGRRAGADPRRKASGGAGVDGLRGVPPASRTLGMRSGDVVARSAPSPPALRSHRGGFVGSATTTNPWKSTPSGRRVRSSMRTSRGGARGGRFRGRGPDVEGRAGGASSGRASGSGGGGWAAGGPAASGDKIGAAIDQIVDNVAHFGLDDSPPDRPSRHRRATGRSVSRSRSGPFPRAKSAGVLPRRSRGGSKPSTPSPYAHATAAAGAGAGGGAGAGAGGGAGPKAPAPVSRAGCAALPTPGLARSDWAAPVPAAPSMEPDSLASVEMRVGSTTRKSPHHPNEDRVLIVADLGQSLGTLFPAQTTLLMVCDGHGGSRCAEYLVRQFPTDLLNIASTQLRALDVPTPDTIRLSSLGVALALGFQETEDRWMRIAQRRRDSSGACLTAALIRGNLISVANVGDCRAVFHARDGTLTQLTAEHRCDLASERSRIKAAGGFIRAGRVLGILEPTRTIGDLEEKALPGVVVATPDVKDFQIPKDPDGLFVKPLVGASSGRGTGRRARRVRGALPRVPASASFPYRVLVIATDGVWDVVQSKAALSIVCTTLEETEDPRAAAMSLSRAAAQLGSQDDISVIVAWFI